MREWHSYLKLIYSSDDVVVDVRDDRRSEEQILEHITGALQEAFGQSSDAAQPASDFSTAASLCAYRRGRALGLWLPIFAAILTLLVSSAAWLLNAR
jgi:hypothetical protein